MARRLSDINQLSREPSLRLGMNLRSSFISAPYPMKEIINSKKEDDTAADFGRRGSGNHTPNSVDLILISNTSSGKNVGVERDVNLTDSSLIQSSDFNARVRNDSIKSLNSLERETTSKSVIGPGNDSLQPSSSQYLLSEIADITEHSFDMIVITTQFYW